MRNAYLAGKMAELVLATANARYSHTSLALRALKANLGRLAAGTALLEFTLDDRPADILEKIIFLEPRIIGLSVYLWNAVLLEDVVSLIKLLRPDIAVVLGGPEVSFETAEQRICSLADYVISGEGELEFARLCGLLLEDRKPEGKVIQAAELDLKTIELPYEYYCAEDIAHRTVYVEMSRGCSHGCEFCLSSLSRRVRRFAEDDFLKALQSLWERGARSFKFIDRSLHLSATPRLLDFFLDCAQEGLFVHFELIPDKLRPDLLEALARFPKGAIQIEAGVQTLNEEVAARIGRKQNTERALCNIKDLLTKTGVHVHTDLVVGLPGEDLASLAKGFDRLIALSPQEIQIGILKRLRGAPISRHDEEWSARYNPKPPYDVLENRLLDFKTLQRLKRLARYFDLIYNSGKFRSTSKLILKADSPFDRFLRLSDWLYTKTGQTQAIAQRRLIELVYAFLVEELGISPGEAADKLTADSADRQQAKASALPPRQRRHVRA